MLGSIHRIFHRIAIIHQFSMIIQRCLLAVFCNFLQGIGSYPRYIQRHILFHTFFNGRSRRHIGSKCIEWIDTCQRTAPVIQQGYIIIGVHYFLCHSVTKAGIEILNISIFFSLLINITLQKLHVLFKLFLNLLEVIGLLGKPSRGVFQLISGIFFQLLGISIHHLLQHAGFHPVEAFKGGLRGKKLGQITTHDVDEVVTRSPVTSVEVLGFTMPLVQIITLLIINVIVDIQTVQTCLCQQVLHDRRHNFLLYLTDAIRHCRAAAVFCNP